MYLPCISNTKNEQTCVKCTSPFFLTSDRADRHERRLYKSAPFHNKQYWHCSPLSFFTHWRSMQLAIMVLQWPKAVVVNIAVNANSADDRENHSNREQREKTPFWSQLQFGLPFSMSTIFSAPDVKRSRDAIGHTYTIDDLYIRPQWKPGKVFEMFSVNVKHYKFMI